MDQQSRFICSRFYSWPPKKTGRTHLLSRRPGKILTTYCSVTLIIVGIGGKVVNALGLGTTEMGLFSTSGVPARLNWVTPAPGNWSTAVPSLYSWMLEEISPVCVGSTPLPVLAKNQSLENPSMVAIARRSPFCTLICWETLLPAAPLITGSRTRVPVAARL